MPDRDADRRAGPPSSHLPPRIGGEGEPCVFVADEQDALVVDTKRWAALAEQVLAREGVRGNAELSLLFVAEHEIAELNDRFLGHDGPTDVLAFPIDAEELEDAGPDTSRTGPGRSSADAGDLPLLLGDVVICPAVAARNAPDHAGTVDDELALLVVHGVLHVMGHDHADAEETIAMRRRERELLEELHWAGPAPASFRADEVP